jgi:hypothetical protein
MITKDATVETRFSAEAWAGLVSAEALLPQYTDQELVVTSGSEAIKHSVPRSAHHRGDAWDIRRWYLGERAADYAAELAEILGTDWVVLLESDHIHAHWAPVVF